MVQVIKKNIIVLLLLYSIYFNVEAQDISVNPLSLNYYLYSDDETIPSFNSYCGMKFSLENRSASNIYVNDIILLDQNYDSLPISIEYFKGDYIISDNSSKLMLKDAIKGIIVFEWVSGGIYEMQNDILKSWMNNSLLCVDFERNDEQFSEKFKINIHDIEENCYYNEERINCSGLMQKQSQLPRPKLDILEPLIIEDDTAIIEFEVDSSLYRQ